MKQKKKTFTCIDSDNYTPPKIKNEGQVRGGKHKPRKKIFVCGDCLEEYKAAWTKGLCPRCVKRKNYNLKYKSVNPYGHFADSVTDHEDNEWIPVAFPPYRKHGGHSIVNRSMENWHNHLVREHYTSPSNMIINILFEENI